MKNQVTTVTDPGFQIPNSQKGTDGMKSRQLQQKPVLPMQIDFYKLNVRFDIDGSHPKLLFTFLNKESNTRMFPTQDLFSR